MEDVLVITAAKIRRSFAYASLIETIRVAFGRWPEYGVRPPVRHVIVSAASKKKEKELQPSVALMSAWGTDAECPYILLKSVTVIPENGAKGLPAVTGTYVLSTLESGKQLAVMDGTEIILWRTACVSALAADYLARKDSRVMVMVGAGALAPHLIQGHITTRPSLEKVLVWNRTHSRAQKLVEQLKSSSLLTGRLIEAVTDLEAAVREADIISCATLSCEPLVRGEWLTEGAHLDLVGSFTPGMRECDDECIRRCRILVDTYHAVDTSGDLINPLERDIVPLDHVAGTLSELVQGFGPDLMQVLMSETTLFKSVGCTVGDLAAAQVVYEKLTS